MFDGRAFRAQRRKGMLDAHVHLEKGPYTFKWINEFIHTAMDRNIDEIRFVEHSHRFLQFEEMYNEVTSYSLYQKEWLERKCNIDLVKYKSFVEECRTRKFPINVKFGMEVCYFSEHENALKNLLSDFNWDFITGSIHWIDGWGFDHKEEHWSNVNIDVAYRRYYEEMIKLVRSGIFTTLAHPDSIKCFGKKPAISMRVLYESLATELQKNNVSTEVSSGLYNNYGCKEIGINEELLLILIKANVALLTASDAHSPSMVGKMIKECEEIIERNRRTIASS
ncbi:MAG: hypothetical protein KA807_19650 [Prolixibacteraceae bacterium]|nr:hypothetical protein [Prolixibacteraceae bacterium]